MADSNTLSAQRAKGYLRDLGWTNNQAAGLVGNFQQESGVNLDPSIVSPDGTSYGIAQWTGTRQNIFQQVYGKPIQGTSLKEQLDFVHYELNNNEKAAGNALRATTTPTQAALVVSNQYERPNAAFAKNSQRVAYAENAAATPVVVANNDTLSQSEQDKLNNQNAGGGEAIEQKIQNQADAELGADKVEVSPVTFVQNNENPNAANTSMTGSTTIKSQPLPNRLKEYPSYIYGLSLHILTEDQYNLVVEQQTYTPANVLIASAGRYSSTFPRNEFFSEDFYFEDCSILTVIAPNDVSRNTNAVDVSFTLIEPYGFTLMERLLQVANAIKSKNYLDMPYLLQIDFFAIDDAGNIVGSIDQLKKRIPIKLNTMDMRVSAKGTEYRVTASPYNHTAYDSTSATTPANFEITASTVAEFFQSAADAEQFSQILAVQNSAAQRETATKNAPTPATNTNANRLSTVNFAAGAIPTTARNQTQKTPPSKKTYTSVKSYGSAINDWYRALRENGKTDTKVRPDVYKFVFLPDPETGEDVIGSAAFIQKNLNTPKDSPMKSNQNTTDTVTMARSDLGDTKTGIHDISKAIFQIQYGTTIEKLLEYVIRNSDYYQRQLIVPEDPDYDRQKEAFKNKPLYWFKIVPIVRLLDFDTVKKIWNREITYTVQPYKIYNIRLDVGPQGVTLAPVKNYEYIYTGHNDDVFDFDISFNALYYNQVTAYRDSLSDLNPSGDSLSQDYKYQNSPNYSGGDPPKSIDYNAVMPLVLKPIVQNSKAQATGGATTARDVAGVDLNDSIMTNSQADLLVVNLKILGDPDFIKQDDVFYRPVLPEELPNIASKPSNDPRLLPNDSSLVMDEGGVYAQLLFRTPTDIDENTGLMKFNPNYKHSVFSGLYNVVQVTSTFSNGQFVQELVLTRLPRQSAFDYVNNSQNNKSDNRNESSQQKQPGLTPPNPNPAPTNIVSGGGAPASPADAADTATDSTAGKDQKVSQIENATPPVENQSQADLRGVKDTAPTENINNQTEPAPYDRAAEFKASQVRSIQTSINVAQQQLATAQKEGDTVRIQELNTYISQLNESLVRAQSQ
jgi:hypothetical protein